MAQVGMVDAQLIERRQTRLAVIAGFLRVLAGKITEREGEQGVVIDRESFITGTPALQQLIAPAGAAPGRSAMARPGQ